MAVNVIKTTNGTVNVVVLGEPVSILLSGNLTMDDARALRDALTDLLVKEGRA